MAHEVEDVDLPDLTPWEVQTVQMAVTALRRHGFSVTIAGPGGAMSYPARQPADKPPVAVLSDADLAAKLSATPEEIRFIRAREAGGPHWGGPILRDLSPEEMQRIRDAWDVVGPQMPITLLEPAEGYDESLDCPCPLHQAARDRAL